MVIRTGVPVASGRYFDVWLAERLEFVTYFACGSCFKSRAFLWEIYRKLVELDSCLMNGSII